MADTESPMANIAAEIVAGMSDAVREEVERKCAEAIANAASWQMESAVRTAVAAELNKQVVPRVTAVVAAASPQIVAAVEAAIPEIAKALTDALVAKIKKNATSYRMDELVKGLLS